MSGLTIGGLAREGGVGVETVRYYQRRGLMAEPQAHGPGAGRGVRRYGPEEVRRLRFIRTAQAAGFKLDEIGRLLALDAGHDGARVQEMARHRIAALDERITALQETRSALVRLADRCAATIEGPCPILAAFDGERA